MPPEDTITTKGAPQTDKSNRLRQQRGKIVINGKIYEQTSDSAAIQIGLKQRNLKISTSISTNEAALMLLAEYDCGVSGEKFDFSLSDDQTETLDNENIMDEERYKKLEPQEIPAIESFPDVKDPFYQLDDELPEGYQVEQADASAEAVPSYIRTAITLMRSQR